MAASREEAGKGRAPGGRVCGKCHLKGGEEGGAGPVGGHTCVGR